MRVPQDGGCIVTSQQTPSATASTPSVQLLEVLPHPEFNSWSEQQVRGKACLWCAVTLDNATAVDLGQRRVRRLDGHVTVFPRGCVPCVRDTAHARLFDHVNECEQCVDDFTQCEPARILRRLTLKGRP
jgi:hypothetical protein